MVLERVLADKRCVSCGLMFARRRWPDGNIEEAAKAFESRQTCAADACIGKLIWSKRPRRAVVPCQDCERPAVSKGMCANHRRQQTRRDKRRARSEGRVQQAGRQAKQG